MHVQNTSRRICQATFFKVKKEITNIYYGDDAKVAATRFFSVKSFLLTFYYITYTCKKIAPREPCIKF